MKMKRFVANEMRQAIQRVGEELGPDALILSNRRVADGVEIIAAVDYEEALLADDAVTMKETGARSESIQENSAHVAAADVPAAQDPSYDVSMREMQLEIKTLRNMLEVPLSRLAWAEMGRQQPQRAKLYQRLLALGLHTVVANRIADEACDVLDPDHGWRRSLSLLEGMLPVTDDELMIKGGVVALVGPTGVGKTTTVAKLAARFAMRHGRRNVALVTMDCYRIGAHDQLRTYGRLLGVPVHIAGDREELRAVINHMHGRKLILVDTAGASQRDIRLSEQFATLETGDTLIRRYLVLSAAGETATNDEVVRAFSRVNPHSCILTKVDEATKLGGVFSVLMKHKLPVAYVGDGQRVPDDIQPARARRLMVRSVALMKSSGMEDSEESWLHAFGTQQSTAHDHAYL
jgi:flagellar biosynthesis protein FlhF